MAKFVPTKTSIIPVHPATEGYNTQKLVVDKFEFPAATQPATQKIAFLWSHSNGFHKESNHALIRRLLAALAKKPEYSTADIHMYTWDSRNHGDSARVNDGKLTETFSWFDNAMDTKQVIDVLDLAGYNLLFGVGHSFGGTAMILCEFLYPKTFDGLCLLEPVLSSFMVDAEVRENFPAFALTLKRRDEWPSRDECRKALLSRGGFWKGLDPEVFDNYVNYALYDTPEGTVKLKCAKRQEYLVYKIGPYASLTAFNGLKAMTIPTHVILAEGSTFTPPALAEDIAKMSPMVTCELVKGSHMVPLEQPDNLIPGIVQLVEKTTNAAKKQAKL